MQLERRQKCRQPSSIFHHRLADPSNQPPDLRYPIVPDLAQGLESIALDIGELVENTFPATHRFFTKHATLPVHNFIHVHHPYLPFVQ